MHCAATPRAGIMRLHVPGAQHARSCSVLGRCDDRRPPASPAGPRSLSPAGAGAPVNLASPEMQPSHAGHGARGLPGGRRAAQGGQGARGGGGAPGPRGGPRGGGPRLRSRRWTRTTRTWTASCACARPRPAPALLGGAPATTGAWLARLVSSCHGLPPASATRWLTIDLVPASCAHNRLSDRLSGPSGPGPAACPHSLLGRAVRPRSR